jgi:hypothetical protein
MPTTAGRTDVPVTANNLQSLNLVYLIKAVIAEEASREKQPSVKYNQDQSVELDIETRAIDVL